MKRPILVLLIPLFLLVSCNIKKETVKLSITQTAMVTAQADLTNKHSIHSTEIAQESANFTTSMNKTQEAHTLGITKTQQAFSSNLLNTQEVFEIMGNELTGTQVAQAATATFQVSIITTQQVINEKEIERNRILDEAAEARLNSDVVGIDPILDELLLSTDVSIGQEDYEFKGIRYSEQPVTGVYIASRFIYYDFSTSEDSYIRIMSTQNPSRFPYDYRQLINNTETGEWKRVLVNQHPFFYKINGYGNEVATIVNINDGCSVLVAVNNKYSDAVNSWIDYLVDTRIILLATELPLCEGD